jgi:hypothetical protein
MLKCVFLIGIVFMLGSCGPDKTVESFKNWDSHSYFQSETERLQREHKGLQKDLFFDKQHQTTQQPNPDWLKELEPFMSIDLQKPAYQKRFNIDTLNTGEQDYAITYLANDSQIDLRSCTIQYHNQQVVNVRIEFGQRNSIYKSSRILEYHTDSGYTISGDQDITMGDPVNYRIKGKFTAP